MRNNMSNPGPNAFDQDVIRRRLLPRAARPQLLGKTDGSIRNIACGRTHGVARFLPDMYRLVTSQRPSSSSHGGIEDVHDSGTEPDPG
jgi:hypothetical protein